MAGILLIALLQVELKPQCKTGSEYRVDVTSELVVDIVVEDREHFGTTQRKQTVSTTLNESFLQKIAEARDGRAVRFTLVCEKSVSERSGTGIEATGLVPTSRHGKTILVTRDALGHSVMIGTESAGAEASYVGRWEGIADMLPSGSKKTGDKWPTPWSALGFLSSSAVASKLEGKDAECTLTAFDGATATIQFQGQLKASPTKQESITIDLKGTLIFNVAAGRPVSLTAEGSLALDRKVIEKEFRPEIDEYVLIEAGTLSVRSSKWNSSVAFVP
jgi:hypothetical protein